MISTTRAATVRPSTGAGAVAGYALGHAAEEQRRLDNQGAMIRPQTERLLREAGLGPGMRVLDAGCGTGDVTLQVAELVGPRGMVVGVDRSAEALATAGERVAARGLGQVGFVQEDVAAMTAARPFDAVVGRLLLMHQPEPAAVLRHLAGLVRPGGTVAFLEFALVPILAVPARPLYERAYGWVLGAMTRAGIQVDLGLHLDAVFAAAGLPVPALRIESLVFAGADPGLGLLAETVRTLVPAIERFGLATAAEVGIDTLLDRLLAEGAAIGGAAWAPAVSAAWVRLPAA